ASTTMASSSSAGSANEASASSSALVSLRQHTHPPAIDSGSSTCPATSPASTLRSPKSLTTTPTRESGSRSRWLRRLVFPAPRYPVRRMTGTAGMLAAGVLAEWGPAAGVLAVRLTALQDRGTCGLGTRASTVTGLERHRHRTH